MSVSAIFLIAIVNLRTRQDGVHCSDGVIADMFFKNQSTVLFPIGADISMCLVVLKVFKSCFKSCIGNNSKVARKHTGLYIQQQQTNKQKIISDCLPPPPPKKKKKNERKKQKQNKTKQVKGVNKVA